MHFSNNELEVNYEMGRRIFLFLEVIFFLLNQFPGGISCSFIKWENECVVGSIEHNANGQLTESCLQGSCIF